MQEVKFVIDGKGRGGFYLMDGDTQIGEMTMAIADKEMTVFHTEISPAVEGKGLAKLLLSAMVEHARSEGLKVIPLCPYVHAQFKRHAADYAEIWKQEGS